MAFERYIEIVVGPKGGQGFKITDLYIEFTVEKTQEQEPNTGTIKIYNLSENTSSQVCVAGNHITLKAGYKDETIAALFFGDVVKGQRKRMQTDYVTELAVKESRTAVMASQVSISYDKNIEATTIIQALIDAIGLPSVGIENVPSDAQYPGGFSDIGNACDILTTVLNKFDLTFTIQNEQLYIIKPGEIVETTGLVLNKDTGLLTLPQPISDKTGDSDIESEASNKWSFKALLFPELIPGAGCKVESSTYNGELLIMRATFKGDNRVGDFYVECEGISV
ncbi:MAG: hypothetical protein LBO67_04840 [Spirochaetaceae bacterium]|jgi:hypothetical protein|nr:hypothetical protein [Spirochaetaceae bacterium]